MPGQRMSVTPAATRRRGRLRTGDRQHEETHGDDRATGREQRARPETGDDARAGERRGHAEQRRQEQQQAELRVAQAVSCCSSAVTAWTRPETAERRERQAEQQDVARYLASSTRAANESRPGRRFRERGHRRRREAF